VVGELMPKYPDKYSKMGTVLLFVALSIYAYFWPEPGLTSGEAKIMAFISLTAAFIIGHMPHEEK
jgi:hypothetical protein